MKKWIISIALLVIASFIGLSIYGYQLIREPLKENYNLAEQYTLENNLLQTIEEVEYYHGTDAYYVVYGNDAEGDSSVVWVANDFDGHDVRKADEGIDEEQVRSIVEAEHNVKSIQRIRLGYERNLPTYEVTFIDEQDRQSYFYVTFEDGTFMKRYHLNRD
ncbi:hypothetical protein BTS2_2154 [Bacillus sp. TS-2]|nr:hypothetical protein BTS2_2154 [Bacillus sp. TS-2]